MKTISINKLTLKQYLLLNNISYDDIKQISNRTLSYIMKGSHDGHKYNKRYKGNNPYYPTDKTIKTLSEDLKIDESLVKKLIDNQLKSLDK